MAKLTISDAARVAGVARFTLHRALNAGHLSVDPDGSLDTAELLRAGYTLQRSTQQMTDEALQDATPRNRSAQQSHVSAEIQPFLVLQQERALLRMERALLRREREASQVREQAALAREQEAREERQAAREREALLLRMVEQMQQRYDRLLDMPRATLPPESPVAAPGATQARRRTHSTPLPQIPPQGQTQAPPGDPRGAMGRRIVALLQDHPDGLTPAEMRTLLGVERSLADTCLGMLRYGWCSG